MLTGYLFGLGNKIARVSLAHVREARPHLRVVPSPQRVFGEQVDMVADNHQISDFEVGVHPPGGVRNQQIFHAQRLHHPHGESHLLHVVALIVMEPALHGQHVHAAQLAHDELAAVPFHGRYGEVRDAFIRNLRLVRQFGHQVAQSRSQDDADFGLRRHVLPQEVGRFLNFL